MILYILQMRYNHMCYVWISCMLIANATEVDMKLHFSRHLVNRWYVEYESISLLHEDLHKRYRHTHAVDSAGYLYIMEAGVEEGDNWREDPFSQEYFVYNETTHHVWTFNRALSKSTTRTNEVIPGKFHNTSIVHIMPSMPLKQYTSADAHRPIADIILNGNYSVEKKEDIILGEKCILINVEDKEYIWLAINKGYCVLKRIERSSDANKALFVLETKQLRSIAKEIWVPNVFTYKRYDEHTNELYEERQVRILKCETGDAFPESVFTPKILPGTIQYIAENKYVHVSGGGIDMLDNVSKYASNFTGYINAGNYFTYTAFIRVLIALTLGVCAGMLLRNFVKSRFLSKHRKHSGQSE